MYRPLALLALLLITASAAAQEYRMGFDIGGEAIGGYVLPAGEGVVSDGDRSPASASVNLVTGYDLLGNASLAALDEVLLFQPVNNVNEAVESGYGPEASYRFELRQQADTPGGTGFRASYTIEDSAAPAKVVEVATHWATPAAKEVSAQWAMSDTVEVSAETEMAITDGLPAPAPPVEEVAAATPACDDDCADQTAAAARQDCSDDCPEDPLGSVAPPASLTDWSVKPILYGQLETSIPQPPEAGITLGFRF